MQTVRGSDHIVCLTQFNGGKFELKTLYFGQVYICIILDRNNVRMAMYIITLIFKSIPLKYKLQATEISL